MTLDFAVLAGATASGKTAVAVALSKKIPLEIVSSDSMQVYRGLRVVSQAPSAAERRAAVFRLVAFVDPADDYSAARFRDDASKAVESARRRGRLPLLVGGTGLYLRAFLDGLFESDAPPKDEALRERLKSEAERRGSGHLHAKLAAVDAAAAARIHPNDVRRVVRALEVHALTGTAISELQPRRSGWRERPHRFFFLDREREDLYRRIDARVDDMMAGGLAREVKRLRAGKLGRTASAALGIREAGEYLDGRLSREAAADLLKMNTRRYAKRQLSWFRHEKGVERVAVPAAEKPAKTAARLAALLKGGPA